MWFKKKNTDESILKDTNKADAERKILAPVTILGSIVKKIKKKSHSGLKPEHRIAAHAQNRQKVQTC